MAYNNYYQPYYQPIPQYQMRPAEQTQPQIQNGGLVPVPSEQFARNYPVANGLSVTFKDENAPYVYTKTMGFSQLDRPIFEKYRLVKEEATEAQTEPAEHKGDNSTIDDLKAEIKAIKSDTGRLWDEVNAIKEAATREDNVGV